MRYYEGEFDDRVESGGGAGGADGRGAWPPGDSGVDRAGAQIAPDEKITIRSQAGPGRAFPVKVTDFDPPTRLRFGGGMPLGLFGGVRTCEVSPDGHGGTAFHVREEYSGPLLGLIWRSMPDPGPSSGRFARGLKRRVETGR